MAITLYKGRNAAMDADRPTESAIIRRKDHYTQDKIADDSSS